MTTDPKDAEQARKALHKAEKEHCSNFDKGAVFHWAEKGAYVLKADAQAEIARLNRDIERWKTNSRETWRAMQWMRDSINEHVPMPSTESDLLQGPENSVFCDTVARAVISEVLRLTAERDAALAQVAGLHHLIREASDPDFIWGAMDNVNDMDADITEFAKAASRAIQASIPVAILAAAEKAAQG